MMVKTGASVTTEFTTAAPTTGAATDADSLPAGVLYVDGTANGATVTVTNQAPAGVYSAAVTLPSLTAGQIVSVIVSATIGGVACVGKVFEATADTAYPLKPTTDGRTLDVSAGGEAGVDWANVGTPGSTVALSATTVGTLTTYTGNTPQTGDSFARIGANGAGLTAVGDTAGTTTLLSRITALIQTKAEADTAHGLLATAAKLLSYFQSALRKDVTVDPDIGGAYDDATDSQEAIRDRGDAAWGSAGATGALTSGTAQAGSTSTTIKLASGASTTDDLYNYLIVLIDAGTGVGQARMITDYVGSTRVATVDRAWITTPDATSTYRVHHWSDNWAGTVRTLTNAAGDAVDTDADPITRMRGDSWSIEITGIGAIPTWTKAWFTVKCHTGDLDADAWLMVIESNPGAGTDGLQAVYGGGSITAGNAALSVDDTAAGDVTITVAAVETAKLPERATLVYDVQIKLASGDILTRKGTFAVTADVTRATS